MNTINSSHYGPYGAVKAFLKSFIVVNPEISIIPTYIKAAKNCVRYSFLKNCIRSVSDIDITLSTLVGEIVHELFALRVYEDTTLHRMLYQLCGQNA